MLVYGKKPDLSKIKGKLNSDGKLELTGPAENIERLHLIVVATQKTFNRTSFESFEIGGTPNLEIAKPNETTLFITGTWQTLDDVFTKNFIKIDTSDYATKSPETEKHADQVTGKKNTYN